CTGEATSRRLPYKMVSAEPFWKFWARAGTARITKQSIALATALADLMRIDTSTVTAQQTARRSPHARAPWTQPSLGLYLRGSRPASRQRLGADRKHRFVDPTATQARR